MTLAQAENAKKLDYTPVTYDDQYILMVNQLKKYFPIKGGLMSQTVGHVKAVDGVTFNLKRGHTMGLVGESGCGKSTTGRTILRLAGEKTGGQVLFNGKEVYDMTGRELRNLRTKMQIIFQDPFSSLSPRAHCAAGLHSVPGQPAQGLQVPYPLPLCDRALQDRSAAAA